MVDVIGFDFTAEATSWLIFDKIFRQMVPATLMVAFMIKMSFSQWSELET